ncbi:hypothetical protein K432DRAFT_398854 [Lepidopterella palustris CBS 459.81]|uniref:Uncharacterized protein n=1 Tax=Lepidopterella palustris CBS 459.81 TaxID=1314670 RepID=A0A8E2DXD2_9PEZI|nr:hypothetical protein K432DRAFT_398854 [Lepidopterella palustris CBS 459.81]
MFRARVFETRHAKDLHVETHCDMTGGADPAGTIDNNGDLVPMEDGEAERLLAEKREAEEARMKEIGSLGARAAAGERIPEPTTTATFAPAFFPKTPAGWTPTPTQPKCPRNNHGYVQTTSTGTATDEVETEDMATTGTETSTARADVQSKCMFESVAKKSAIDEDESMTSNERGPKTDIQPEPKPVPVQAKDDVDMADEGPIVRCTPDVQATA